MGSSTLMKIPPSPYPSFPFLNPIKSNPPTVKFHHTRISSKLPQILRCFSSRNQKLEKFQFPFSTIDEAPTVQPSSVSERLQRLDFEFKSLPEPLDRVKRLLHYASLLPAFDESSRIQENRVTGCTAQVWLEVKMGGDGLMRFKVDSDSEITKGFCSCLIWALDGVVADEVLSVSSDDLVEINVGFPSRGKSRVNTWHNVLIRMQKRTQDLVLERDRKAFPSLIVNGSCRETQSESVENGDLNVDRFIKRLKDKNVDEIGTFVKNSESSMGMEPAQILQPSSLILDHSLNMDLLTRNP